MFSVLNLQIFYQHRLNPTNQNLHAYGFYHVVQPMPVSNTAVSHGIFTPSLPVYGSVQRGDNSPGAVSIRSPTLFHEILLCANCLWAVGSHCNFGSLFSGNAAETPVKFPRKYNPCLNLGA